MSRQGLAFAALFVIGQALFAGAVEVVEEQGAVTVATGDYRAVFTRANGGLLTKLAATGGTVLLRDWRLYTDRGVYTEGVNYASAHDPQATLAVSRDGGQVQVAAAGRLLAEEAPAPGDILRYEATWTFEDSALRLDLKLSPSFTRELERGFLANLAFVPQFTDFIVDTGDGNLLRSASSEARRTYQSADAGLSPQRRELTFLMPTGERLRVRVIDSQPHLSNLFLHENGNGQAALFLAWMDGPTKRRLVVDKPWTLSLEVAVGERTNDAH